MKFLSVFLASFLLLSNDLASQAPLIKKKFLSAIRTEGSIKIDGELDEMEWQKAPIAENFVQNSPRPGKTPIFRTEVKVLYDNTAIYIGAVMHDNRPDSIFQELTERDNIGNSDWFAVLLDPYRDGINGVGFAITPRGVQFDTKYSSTSGGRNNWGGILGAGERSWDAVWDSQAKITDNGWVVELKIPFSALRFPKAKEQVWNINFVRQLRRHRELCFWNEVNPDITGYLNQSGEVIGISDIEPPIRLSATPFVAVYGENYYNRNNNPKSSWGRSFSGGMDIKYGINDAFTLDMTLIPDFGQVRSDNEVLNLSPYEVRYDENRQFFTEGTELFNKGGLFYSRRVGGRPIKRSLVSRNLKAGEVIVVNPLESQLINATKLSGRTNKGLGLGLFNAISSSASATVENRETGDSREIETGPMTNYNIVVIDQNLKNNSFISLINTNVLRLGDDYDANVTGTSFNFKNAKQSFAYGGKGVVSQKYFSDRTDLGHAASFDIGKTSGKLQWGASYDHESPAYDINDLGFMRHANNRAMSGKVTFRQNQPFGNFNDAQSSFNIQYERLYAPDVFTGLSVHLDGWASTKKGFAFGLNLTAWPIEENDYFEPRTSDYSRFYKTPESIMVRGWFSTDFRKKFTMDVFSNFRYINAEGQYSYGANSTARYRANDRLSFSLSLRSSKGINSVGYVTKRSNGDIIFGVRDNISLENVFTTKYAFNHLMSFSFRLRHYWAKAEYHSFGKLDLDGSLSATDFNSFSDNSFNTFTIDAAYRWRFAPGSDLFLVWKNNTAVYSSARDNISYDYMESLQNLGNLPQSNSLSVKLIYYLDYFSLKNRYAN